VLGVYLEFLQLVVNRDLSTWTNLFQFYNKSNSKTSIYHGSSRTSQFITYIAVVASVSDIRASLAHEIHPARSSQH
jgi:hypothetical protein